MENALRALKERNIILQNDMKKGEYRLPTRSFAAWIKARKSAEKQAGGRETLSLFGGHG